MLRKRASARLWRRVTVDGAMPNLLAISRQVYLLSMSTTI